MTFTNPDVSTDTSIRTRPGDPALDGDHERMAHIVAPKQAKDGSIVDAAALVMEARINGTPVTALCGKVWIPDRDPKRYPVCQTCKDIFQHAGRNPDGVSPG